MWAIKEIKQLIAVVDAASDAVIATLPANDHYRKIAAGMVEWRNAAYTFAQGQQRAA